MNQCILCGKESKKNYCPLHLKLFKSQGMQFSGKKWSAYLFFKEQGD